MGRIDLTSAVSALLVPTALLLASLSQAQEVEPGSVNPDHPGYHLYRQYCGSCHGLYAKGDGPMAPTLKKEPTDLSRLSEEHGFPLPEARLIEFIDGREMVASHGSREMPVWGDRLYQALPAGTDREARRRETLRLLLSYLESIQRQSSPRERP